MKTIRIILLLSCLTFVFGTPPDTSAQTTTFTYQGRLADSNGPVTGLHDFEFRLFNAATGGPQQGPTITLNDLGVTNGLFVTPLDFGANFPGADRFLQIAVRPGASAGTYATLSPRQPITSTPYAVKALEAAGLPAGAVDAAMLANGAVTGAKLGSGAVTTDKIADGTITVGDVNLTSFSSNFWNTTGNAGTSPSTHFLGTTDNQPVEIRANNRRALRLEPTADSANVIGGNASNVVSAGVVGAVIAGGGASGGNHNRVEADHAAVVGGFGNVAAGAQSVIGGGRGNIAGGTRAVVGGGLFNQALGFASVIAGGNANAATNNWSTIGGGADNLASGYASVIPGGINNTASANFTAAMGYRAKANHNGTFVWADPQEADFSSTGTNQFLIRAAGGVGINTSNPNGAALAVKGNATVDGQFKGGYSGNVISNGVVGGFIGGGGAAFGENRVGAHFASVLGGVGNIASGPVATAMGYVATASGTNSTAMGFITTASGKYSTAMGYINTASGFASTSMGSETAATNNDSTSIGRLTLAGGSASTAMGYRAKALHNGSFVWADQQEEDFDSTAANQFSLRAAGGVRFETGGAGLTVDGRSALLASAIGQPLVFSVNGIPALRIEPTTATPNVIGGYGGNIISNGVVGGFIGGGGMVTMGNIVGGDFGSVLGGVGNRALGLASVAMGDNNTASGHLSRALGSGSTASGFASTSMGYRARALHDGSFVWADQQEEDFDSTSTNQFNVRAAGGLRLANDTSLSFGNQHRQMINLYNTDYGIGAQSETTYFRTGREFRWYRGGSHSDAFGDPGTGGRSLMRLGSSGDLLLQGKLGIGTTTAGAQLEVVAAQGIGRFTSTNTGNGSVLIFNNQSALPDYLGAINFETNGMTVGQIGYLANDQISFRVGGQERMTLDAWGLTVNGAFVSASDRNVKEDFATVDAQEVLAKVAALPLQSWSYTNRPGVKHVGPMAQDFRAAFGLGEDDKHIATVDADGVALAAIQGLNQKLEQATVQLKSELDRKDAEVQQLRQRLDTLEKLFQKNPQP